jgi:hypothetical protein
MWESRSDFQGVWEEWEKEVSNILCKRRFVVLALGYSSAAVEAVRMWEAFFALHICIA